MNSEVKQAKKLLEKLNGEKWWEATDEALAFVREHDQYGEFIDEYELDEMVKHEAEQGTTRVMCFLGKCESLCPPYGWRINGYGNVEETTLDDLKMFLEDFINNN